MFGVNHTIVECICVGIGITEGFLDFKHINECDSLIVEAVPLLVFERLDVAVVVSVISCTIMDQHGVQFIHKRALFKVGFDELFIFSLKLQKLLFLFLLQLLRF